MRERMKKSLCRLMAGFLVLTGCSSGNQAASAKPEPDTLVSEGPLTENVSSSGLKELKEENVSYKNLGETRLLDHIESTVYYDLVRELDSPDYLINEVRACYVSKEYLEEVLGVLVERMTKAHLSQDDMQNMMLTPRMEAVCLLTDRLSMRP